MEKLIFKTTDSLARFYAEDWIEKTKNDNDERNNYNNLSLCLYTSMVYGFANHLPYSIDIEQPEYVPADFLNMLPNDVEENWWFKYEDRRTYFNALVNWGDTFKTGILLQVCNIFQKMILNQIPSDFVITEENYVSWGIDLITNNKEYNRHFFETLKSLPYWYKKLFSSTNNEKRRCILDMMYPDIINKLAGRYDTFKEIDTNGNIIRESNGSIPIRPSKDISMLVYWDYVTYYDGISEVIDAIKNEQLKTYNENKSKFANKQLNDNSDYALLLK